MNCELVCKQKSLKTENPISHNNYLPHSSRTSTVKVRRKIAPKSPLHKKNFKGTDETLNINILYQQKKKHNNPQWMLGCPSIPLLPFLEGIFHSCAGLPEGIFLTFYLIRDEYPDRRNFWIIWGYQISWQPIDCGYQTHCGALRCCRVGRINLFLWEIDRDPKSIFESLIPPPRLTIRDCSISFQV